MDGFEVMFNGLAVEIQVYGSFYNSHSWWNSITLNFNVFM